MSGLVAAAQEAALARIDRAESVVSDLPLDALGRLNDVREAVMLAGGEVDPIEACRLAADAADAVRDELTAVLA